MKKISEQTQANSKFTSVEVDQLHNEIDLKTKELAQTTNHDRIEFLVEDLKLAHKKLRRLSLS